jgi:hypothetical protein
MYEQWPGGAHRWPKSKAVLAAKAGIGTIICPEANRRGAGILHLTFLRYTAEERSIVECGLQM